MKTEDFLRQLNEHTHDASAARIEVETIKTDVRKKGAETL